MDAQVQERAEAKFKEFSDEKKVAIRDFLLKVQDDPKLVERLKAISSDADAQALINEVGGDFTPKELAVTLHRLGTLKLREGELSDEDLDEVLGGGWWGQVIGGVVGGIAGAVVGAVAVGSVPGAAVGIALGMWVGDHLG